MTEYAYELTLLHIDIDMIQRSRDIHRITFIVTPYIFEYQIVSFNNIHRKLLYLKGKAHASNRLPKSVKR